MNGINGLDSCQQLLSTSASRISNLEHIVYDDSLDIEVKTEPMPLQDHEFHQNDKNNSDEMSLQREILRELRKINQRLDNVEAILLGQGPHLDRTPAKPSILPLNTVEEVAAFNKIDDATKKAVVSYLGYLGGSNVRESANLCIKETLSGDCVSQFTWLGRDIGRRPIGTPFYNTKLSAVILGIFLIPRFIVIMQFEIPGRIWSDFTAPIRGDILEQKLSSTDKNRIRIPYEGSFASSETKEPEPTTQ
ncbi:uncharacterized protein LOC117177936 isoform X1 [Belonocnema kinseyi]|uniref:uncharacterized protein LOC117177936 isoform X1 n=1 Tax=Belonocnema kinseyi TaxID=2817044 RepID=UPI00143DA89C|nr:uncharacterized protein LOC117177936 isoform X1 [Belonocnema kinseyi]XP_033224950.1 uncharacterized protein LOC117177936 isoform X1 [Belonocnema kinseyi]XP_033224951.1 uncharacterized protein LOC117177936 isoform X1 [Belonocnema kinseyi]